MEEFATEIFEVDVLDEETIQSAASKFGEKRLDLLIHCAGEPIRSPHFGLGK